MRRDLGAELNLFARAVFAGARIWFERGYWHVSGLQGKYFSPSRAAAYWLREYDHITNTQLANELRGAACCAPFSVTIPPDELGWWPSNKELAGL